MVEDEDGEAVLEEAYSVATGTVLTINSKTKTLHDAGWQRAEKTSPLPLPRRRWSS